MSWVLPDLDPAAVIESAAESILIIAADRDAPRTDRWAERTERARANFARDFDGGSP